MRATSIPITILSTLPSAGVGALLALMLFHTEFDIIGLIGVILLIGIVKKNAIMMIDFAIEAKAVAGHLNSRDAIYQACMLRFRPIMMTTTAAILGAMPLALSFGNGGEIRRPLGIAIVGGLFISQLLTLYTTPVVYLYLDRLGQWSLRRADACCRGCSARRRRGRMISGHRAADGCSSKAPAPAAAGRAMCAADEYGHAPPRSPGLSRFHRYPDWPRDARSG